MPVVAHHEVVIHGECIGVGRSTVDINLPVTHFEVVALVIPDYPPVKGQVLRRKGNGSPLLRNPQRAEIVLIPVETVVVGEYPVARAARFVPLYRNDIGHAAKLLHIGIGQGKQIGMYALVIQNVVFRYAEFVESPPADGIACGTHIIVVLTPWSIPVSYAVDIKVSVYDRYGIARQTDAALHVVFALVGGVGDDRILPLEQFPPAPLAVSKLEFAQHIVIGDIGILHEYGIASGKIKHHDVVALHAAASSQALIGPLHCFRIGLFRLRKWHSVVHQRKRQGSHGHPRPVSHFADTEIIAHQQRLFHRGGGYPVHLEDIGMDERCRDNSEHNGLYPAPGFTVGLVGRLALLMFFAEKEPRQIFRNVDVEYDGQSEKHPRIARPYHEPQNINYRYDGKFGPSIPEKRTHLTPKFLHCSVVLSFCRSVYSIQLSRLSLNE